MNWKGFQETPAQWNCLTPKKSDFVFILYKLKRKIKPIWANVQILQSMREIILKSIHFQNDGIKYGGGNSW